MYCVCRTISEMGNNNKTLVHDALFSPYATIRKIRPVAFPTFATNSEHGVRMSLLTIGLYHCPMSYCVCGGATMWTMLTAMWRSGDDSL